MIFLIKTSHAPCHKKSVKQSFWYSSARMSMEQIKTNTKYMIINFFVKAFILLIGGNVFKSLDDKPNMSRTIRCINMYSAQISCQN